MPAPAPNPNPFSLLDAVASSLAQPNPLHTALNRGERGGGGEDSRPEFSTSETLPFSHNKSQRQQKAQTSVPLPFGHYLKGRRTTMTNLPNPSLPIPGLRVPLPLLNGGKEHYNLYVGG